MKQDDDNRDELEKLQEQRNLLMLLLLEYEEKLKSETISQEDIDLAIEELRAIRRSIR
jgi:hypothetical protein